MIPCHVAPFVRQGPPVDHARTEPVAECAVERCDYCGSSELAWRKCKLVCDSCRQINKSCADL